MDFLKFFSQVKIRYLRQPLLKFLQQLNDYSEFDLVFKLAVDFLVSRYTSLTTKSSHFVWSITAWNLHRFKKCSLLDWAWKVLSAY